MKKSNKSGKSLLLLVFLSSSSLSFAQSAYKETVKENPKSEPKTESKSKYSKDEQAMIDFYSDPKNANEVAKTGTVLDNIKPLGDGFYSVTELAITYEDIMKKLDIFQADYKSPHSTNERNSLLNGIINSYEKANSQAAKAQSQSSNYSESDKVKIAKYKEYYPKVLTILKGMLVN